MTYDEAVEYTERHIALAVDSLKVGDWILVDEDGILKDLFKTIYSYPTKKMAIKEYGCRCLDGRRKPKVQRVHSGHYWYFVKGDDGHDQDPVSIILLTKKNIEKYRTILNDCLTCDMKEFLTLYDTSLFTDELMGEVIRDRVRCVIYNAEDFRQSRSKES